jgi:hypothetical protein
MTQTTQFSAQVKDRRAGNRRAYPRFASTFEVRYAEGKDPLQTGKPMEIGEGGLSLETGDLLPLETHVTVEFKLTGSNEWVRVKAVVRHSEDRKLGLEFLNLKMQDRLKIVDHMLAKK